MSGKRNGLIGTAVALAVIATSTRAMNAEQPAAASAPASPWLALSLLSRADTTIVTASCGAVTATEAAALQPQADQPPKTDELPPPPPIGCLPQGPPTSPTGPRRPGIYVGIAIAAGAGIGAAVALGGGKRSNSPP